MTKKVLLEGLGRQYWEILMEASCPPVRVVNPIPKRDLMWREKGVKQDFRHKFSQGDNIYRIQVFKICDREQYN